MKIKDIIDKLSEEYPQLQECNFNGCPLSDAIQSSLTSLLDSIEKELPGNKEIIITGRLTSDALENAEKRTHNQYRQEVINIINSHR